MCYFLFSLSLHICSCVCASLVTILLLYAILFVYVLFVGWPWPLCIVWIDCMHKMGFAEHERCTSVHFSGMISIRLETCKPFPSSQPQLYIQAKGCTATHTHCNTGSDIVHNQKYQQQRTNATTNHTNKVQCIHMHISIGWLRVFGRNSQHKYANIDHFMYTPIEESERQHRFNKLWNALVMF